MIAFSPLFSSIDEIMKFSPPLVIPPTFDWFLMLIHNGSTLTTPPLHVFGDVQQTENGILLDGKTGWLSAGTLEGWFSIVHVYIYIGLFLKDFSNPFKISQFLVSIKLYININMNG